MCSKTFKKTLIFLFVFFVGATASQSAFATTVGALNNMAQTSSPEYVANPTVMQMVLDAPSGVTITVNYAVTGGNATGGGVDYTLANGTLTFAPGETSKFVPISVVGDGSVEADETVQVTFSNATNATLVGPAINTITFIDDDPRTFSFTKGTSSDYESVPTKNIAVSMSQPFNVGTNVQVIMDSPPGTATGGGVDYTFNSPITVTFNPGETSKNVQIAIVDDGIVDPDETVNLTLANPSDGTPIKAGKGTHVYTILDNDGPLQVYFKVISASITENVTNLSVDGMLSYPFNSPVTVDYAGTGVTATGGGVDYTLANGTLTFNPGDTFKTVPFTIVNDNLSESTETFTVTMSNPSNATIKPGWGVYTHSIIDNDSAQPSLSINDVSGPEGSSPLNLTVTLSAPSGQEVRVDYNTSNGTAVAGQDFTNTSGTLIFNPGDTTRQIGVPITNDVNVESNETFNVNLNNAINATIGDGQGIGTITDNDGATPTFSFAQAETGGGEANVGVQIPVNLNPAAGVTATIHFSVIGGTATGGGDDYTLASGTLSFAPGETTKNITVNIIDDILNESLETIDIGLDTPVNGILGTPNVHRENINASDGALPTVAFANASSFGPESSGHGVMVSLSVASAQTVTVNYAAAGGTATGGGDYVVNTGTLTFLPNDMTKLVPVTIVDDTIPEPDETFIITLSTPNNATLGVNTTHTYTIQANDTGGGGTAGAIVVAVKVPEPVTLSKGETAVIEYFAETQPTNNVTITFKFDGTFLSVNKSTITITPADWQTHQLLTATALSSPVDRQTALVSESKSADPDYNGKIPMKNVNFLIKGVTAAPTTISDITVRTFSFAIVEGRIGNPKANVTSATGNVIDYSLLSYNWAQISGPAVSISNPTSLATASFMAPPANPLSNNLVFCITVTVNGASTTCDGSRLLNVKILPEHMTFDSTHTQIVQGNVVGISNGTAINHTLDADGRVTVQLGANSVVYLSTDQAPRAVPVDPYILVSDYTFDGNRGMVFLFDPAQDGCAEIDVNDPNFDSLPCIVAVTTGNQRGDELGFTVASGIADNDEQRFYVSAPGTSIKTLFVMNSSLDITNVVQGGNPVLSSFGNFNGVTGHEMIIGARSDSDVNEAEAFDGLQSDLAEFVNLDTDSNFTAVPDFSADILAVGDLNGDGLDDEIMASRSACLINVFLGTADLDQFQVTDTFECADSSIPNATLTTLIAIDVTGDGLDDLIVLDSDADLIYIRPGTEDLGEAENTSTGAIIIEGDDFGSDITSGDVTGDGVDELIVTREGGLETVFYDVYGTLNGDAGTLGGEDEPVVAGLTGGGFACDLNTGASPQSVLGLMVLTIGLMVSVVARMAKGGKKSL